MSQTDEANFSAEISGSYVIVVTDIKVTYEVEPEVVTSGLCHISTDHPSAGIRTKVR